MYLICVTQKLLYYDNENFEFEFEFIKTQYDVNYIYAWVAVEQLPNFEYRLSLIELLLQYNNFVEMGNIDTPNMQIHDRPFSLLGTDTSIKGGGVKLVLKIFISHHGNWNYVI
jgi:hypothetical protein